MTPISKPGADAAVSSADGSRLPDRVTRLLLELLRAGETVRFRALGCSMWPTIPPRSLLEVRPSEAAALVAGQLAAFEQHGRVVVHRVTAVCGEHVELWGDALERGDGKIPRARVLGRAHVLSRRPLRPRLPDLRHLRIVLRALRRRWLR
jgi:hypothetical protein